MKEKGFTLIELLAVIVILAVIALIATPLIMGVIDEAKDGANKRSVQNIQQGAETFLLSKKTLDGNYSFNMNDYTFKGNQFGKGTDDERINIVFNDEDEASVAVYENNKCYYILAGSNEVKSETGLDKQACLEKVGKISTPLSCFAYTKTKIVDSYEIDYDKCTMILSLLFSQDDAQSLCSNNQVGNYYDFNTILLNTQILNALKEYEAIYDYTERETIIIEDYLCSEGNKYNNPVINDVVIPDKIDGLSVTHIAKTDDLNYENGSFSLKKINSVKLPNNLEYIGFGCFAGNNLTEITIPKNVNYIGFSAIYWFKHLNFESNYNLSSIKNETGREFNWCNILGIELSNPDDCIFETGSIEGSEGRIVNIIK